MLDLSRLAINQITTHEQWDLPQAIRGYARHGIGAIGIWRDKLGSCGLAAAARLLADHGMAVTGLSNAGRLTTIDTNERRIAFDDNRRAIDEAAAIGAGCLVVVAGGLPTNSKDLVGARARVGDELERLLPYARAADVPLAIEPLHPLLAATRSCLTTLAEANDLCDRLGEGLGVVVDAFHVWWDPALERELRRAAGRILAFQVSDWLPHSVNPRLERGMPGDGVIEFRALRRSIESVGYRGWCEIEILSQTDWWKREPDDVVRTAVERCRSVL